MAVEILVALAAVLAAALAVRWARHHGPLRPRGAPPILEGAPLVGGLLKFAKVRLSCCSARSNVERSPVSLSLSARLESGKGDRAREREAGEELRRGLILDLFFSERRRSPSLRPLISAMSSCLLFCHCWPFSSRISRRRRLVFNHWRGLISN